MKSKAFLAMLLLTYSNPFLCAIDLDRAPIHYASAQAENAVSVLEGKLKSKAVELKPDDEHGFLLPLLKAFDIPLSSQVLVFSKTSLQRHRISPQTPRAIYFNDDIAVGFCQRGDVLEIAAADPNLGTVFYTLEQNPQKPLKFTRQTESCLICHGSSRNQGFPGHLNRSLSTDRTGELVLSLGSKRVDHTTPFEDRWGGWYVTGKSGKQSHQGNRIVNGWPWVEKGMEPDFNNITDLKPFFTVATYPTPHSDLIALLVLEHQGDAQNRLTQTAMLTRHALYEQETLNKSFGRPNTERSEGITRRIEGACETVVQYFLFNEEAKFAGKIEGSSEFAKEFVARGPFDAKKRSLREFDLTTRLFRFPMSYVIYSKQFDGLPGEAKERIYRRLWEVLTGKDQSKPFEHLSGDDRRAILEILRETKPGLPGYWKD